MLNQEQISLLKSRYVERTSFQVADVNFDCWYGEWIVTKSGKHVDTFTFNLYENDELEQTIHDIFYNTDKVTLVY